MANADFSRAMQQKMAKVKILLFIDNLSSGGAQRQLCFLAKQLVQMGYSVTVLVYFEDNFFEADLINSGIEVERVRTGGKFSKVYFLRNHIRNFKPHVLIAFMATPAFIAEMSSLPTRKFGLIVSERSGKVGDVSMRDKIRLKFHLLADYVVTNSNHLRDFVVNNCPSLEGRTLTINNCVDLHGFNLPVENLIPEPVFDFAVIARHSAEKNSLNLCRALHQLKRRKTKVAVRITWYGDWHLADGDSNQYSRCFIQLKELINELNLESDFILKPQTTEVINAYGECDAVCLASFFEGFSNVLGEAVACGKPVIASRVCDNHVLVRHGENGFLFDPESVGDIADALEQMAALSPGEYKKMALKSQSIAHEVLSPDRFADAYANLIQALNNKYHPNVFK